MTGEARARFERIYTLLRERICLLDYPPGMRLREEDLAEEFDTSRTPIRRGPGAARGRGLSALCPWRGNHGHRYRHRLA